MISIDDLILDKSKQGDAIASAEIASKYYEEWQAWFWKADNLLTEEEADKYLDKSLNFYKLSLQQGNIKANYDIFDIYRFKHDKSSCLFYLYEYIKSFTDKDKTSLVSILTICEEHRLNFGGDIVFSEDDIRLCFLIAEKVFSRNSEKDIQPTFYVFINKFDTDCLEQLYNKYCVNNYKFESSFGEYYLLRKNIEKAIYHLEKGEKKGSSLCCELLGDLYFGCYSNDLLDYNKAILYFEKEINLGDDLGKLKLAKVLAEKDPNIYYGKIIELYKNICQTHKESYGYLGLFLLQQKEFERANNYFYLGYSNGDILSSIHYANNLINGVGCNRDLEEAINILNFIDDILQTSDPEKIEDFNFIYEILCDIYISNKYFRKNYKKLFEFAEKGSQLGNAKCQYILGECYINGYGIEVDKNKGYFLLNQASDNGFNIDKSNQLFADMDNSNLNVNVDFYINQIAQKDFLIKKQQEEISKITDKIMILVEDTNKKVTDLSAKIDDILNFTAQIKNTLGKRLNSLSPDSEEYETQASEINSISVENTNIDLFDQKTIDNLIKLFGDDNWQKLSLESRKYLITAKIVFYSLSSKNNDNVDYSSVCLMICKAIENELKKRFFFQFVEYLGKKYNKDYSYYHAQLTTCTRDGKYILKKEGSITLGDYAYIFCASFTKNKFIDYFEESQKDILDYCNDEIFNKHINQSYLDTLSNKINKIRNDYRNPACHVSCVSFVTAKACVDYVLDYTKFLINFLSDCKK